MLWLPPKSYGLILSLVMLTFGGRSAHAFCGFFAGKAGADMYNQASQVVIVHDEGNTVLTMVNDYQGPLANFALVVPVPVVLEKEVVRVADVAAVDHLDAFSAPRLAEYFDPNPCHVYRNRSLPASAMADGAIRKKSQERPQKKPLVKVEASYTVGEYDIVILSSTESNALEKWLRANQYNIPKGASQALAPYIRSGMKFFVAKVNIEEMKKAQFQKLRPLQFAFSDKRFMLPIRLGMINAKGPQDLLAYVITKDFRTEVVNYRNPKLPSNMDVPTFVKDNFAEFYDAFFQFQHENENNKAVWTEYAWNMSWCDPCASSPLSAKELQELGVWWIAGNQGGNAQRAFVTRLHARYTPQTFPEDLMLKVTKDRQNFQGRYVVRHPYQGAMQCEAASAYRQQVLQRRQKEIAQLAAITGWRKDKIKERMKPLPKEFQPEADKPPSFLERVRNMFGN